MKAITVGYEVTLTFGHAECLPEPLAEFYL